MRRLRKHCRRRVGGLPLSCSCGSAGQGGQGDRVCVAATWVWWTGQGGAGGVHGLCDRGHEMPHGGLRPVRGAKDSPWRFDRAPACAEGLMRHAKGPQARCSAVTVIAQKTHRCELFPDSGRGVQLLKKWSVCCRCKKNKDLAQPFRTCSGLSTRLSSVTWDKPACRPACG